jgi:branched-chain amino acid transport system substrate-binding protein
MFQGLGTACQTAVQKYLNNRKVPQLFVQTGADKFADPEHFHWTMPYPPTYRTEAAIWGKFLLAEKPAAKIAILYQNDDFGKDYLIGLRAGLGDAYDRMVVKAASYETTDPTVDSQIVTLQSAGADTLLTAATPKWAAQTIRKIADLGWKPLHFVSVVSISVSAVINPAGPDKATGMVAVTYTKDNAYAQWANDPGMIEWRAFMKRYLPTADQNDIFYSYGYGAAYTLAQVLKQCGDDLSRDNIMRQATNLRDLEVPVLLPGIRINTSATNLHPIRSLQLQRWAGSTWQRFGEVFSG